MRGYDKDEVTAFLVTLAKWNVWLTRQKELRIKYEASNARYRNSVKLKALYIRHWKQLRTQALTWLTKRKNRWASFARKSSWRLIHYWTKQKERAKNTMDEAEQSAKEVIEDMEQRLMDLFRITKPNAAHQFISWFETHFHWIARPRWTMKKTEDFNPDQYLNRSAKSWRKLSIRTWRR